MISNAQPRVLPKPEVLRRNVVSKLEAMNEQQLAHVYEWLLQLELEQAVRDLGEGIAADEDAGRLTPEAIESSIREYRRKHPYDR
jgi:hypothetical protein